MAKSGSRTEKFSTSISTATAYIIPDQSTDTKLTAAFYPESTDLVLSFTQWAAIRLSDFQELWKQTKEQVKQEFSEDEVIEHLRQALGDEYEEGMKLLRELYAKASKDERVDVPLSELRVGLKCGGSDGFSGITANPLLGMDGLTARRRSRSPKKRWEK